MKDLKEVQFTWKRAPFEHQREMALFHYYHPFSASLSEVGVGKTAPVITVLWHLHRAKKLSRTLIVCPKSIMANWIKELLDWSDLRAEIAYHDSKVKRIEILRRQDLEVVIINYEGARILDGHLSGFDSIVCDEVHALKNRSAKQTKAVMAIAPWAKLRIGISGTPFLNNLEDLWSVFNFIDPKVFYVNFWGFRQKYMEDRNKFKTWMKFPDWQPKPGAIEEVKKKIVPASIAYKKRDVLKFLPPVLFERRDVELSEEQSKAYNQIKRDFLLALKEGVMPLPNILSRVNKLLQVTGGFVYWDDEDQTPVVFVDNAKLKELDALLSGELAGQKVIIWCNYREEVRVLWKAIKEKFHPNEIGLATLDGSTPQSLRQPLIDAFNASEGPTTLIANPAVGGQGLTILAPYMIYFSRGWKLLDREQSLGRNNRPGAEKFESLTVIDLVARETVDERVLWALQQKGDTLRAIKEGVERWL